MIQAALAQYRAEVSGGVFPGPAFSPYRISEAEVLSLVAKLHERGLDTAAEAVMAQFQAEKQGRASLGLK